MLVNDRPCPRADKVTEPREMEHSTVRIERIQERNGLGLLGDWIQAWSLPEAADFGAHDVDGLLAAALLGLTSTRSDGWQVESRKRT